MYILIPGEKTKKPKRNQKGIKCKIQKYLISQRGNRKGQVEESREIEKK